MNGTPKVHKLFLEMVPRSPVDYVATHVAWVFSWSSKITCDAAWAVHVSKICATGLVISRPSWDFWSLEWFKNSLRRITLGIRFMEDKSFSTANLSRDSPESFQWLKPWGKTGRTQDPSPACCHTAVQSTLHIVLWISSCTPDQNH